jgi:hypothetical protein
MSRLPKFLSAFVLYDSNKVPLNIALDQRSYTCLAKRDEKRLESSSSKSGATIE